MSACVYNKDIFADLGLEVPRTYEDFKAVCQAIKDSGKTPLYEACQNGWHQVLPLFETGSYYVTLYDDLYDLSLIHIFTADKEEEPRLAEKLEGIL